MNWHYVEAGQPAGPVEETLLEEMLRSGRIQADTLVWREGMANWQPYHEVRPAAAEVLPPGEPPTFGAPPVAGEEVVCAECNRIFTKDNAIRYGEQWVCANCKPLFVQKLREGVSVALATPRVYGGFWIRFLAKFLDNIITSIAGFPVGLVLGVAMPSQTPTDTMVQQAIASLIGLAIGAAYNIFFVGRFGATPGKMALRLKVITAEGGPVSYGLATGRYFAELLSGCPTLFIGYIMVAFDDEKRALHDRICNTRVIRT